VGIMTGVWGWSSCLRRLGVWGQSLGDV